MKNYFDTIDQVSYIPPPLTLTPTGEQFTRDSSPQTAAAASPHHQALRSFIVSYFPFCSIVVFSDEPTGRLALVFELMDMNMYDAIKGRRHYLPENRTKYYIY
jgi:hypothetical protein